MRGESGSRRKNYFFFSALASGLASAFLSPAAAAFASPLAGAFSPALPAGGFRAFFLLFLGHLDIARSRSGFGRDHFFFGARRGDGDDGDMLVAQNFHAFRRLDVAKVNGLADFEAVTSTTICSGKSFGRRGP